MSKSFKTIYNFLRLAILKTHQPFFIFIVNFEHISHLVLVFLLLTLSRYADWVSCLKLTIEKPEQGVKYV